MVELDDKLTASSHVICSQLGTNGRFANQVFQHMFLLHHATENGLRYANPPWVGDEMFCVQTGVKNLPIVARKARQDTKNQDDCPVFNSKTSLFDTDVWGYFQFATGYYAKNRDLIQRRFQFRGAYAEYATDMRRWLVELGRPVVSLHIRRGDYGHGYFYLAPCAWYIAWLKELENCVGTVTVFIATDAPKHVLHHFKDFHVVSAADAANPPTNAPGFFQDFAALTIADYVAISNSSFSFAATMFNQTAKLTVRPRLQDQALIEYDPWAAEVLLKDAKAEDFGRPFLRLDRGPDERLWLFKAIYEFFKPKP